MMVNGHLLKVHLKDRSTCAVSLFYCRTLTGVAEIIEVLVMKLLSCDKIFSCVVTFANYCAVTR